MGVYTTSMEGRIKDLYPDDDDYLEKLQEIVKSFRPFDQALDSFLTDHGFEGDIEDVKAKASFIRARYHEKKITVLPRNLSRWFTEKKRMERETAFSFCFAFGLSLEETEDFFRRILLERGFDFHQIRDCIYGFAIRQGLSWEQTCGLLNRAPKPAIRQIDPDQVEYTSAVLEDLQKITDPDDLIRFFEENLKVYSYNNAAAMKNIRHLWGSISSEKGLANQEAAGGAYSYRDEMIEGGRKPAKESTKSRSVWHVFLQILGITRNMEQNLRSDRSLKPILKDNRLLHPFVEDSFPDKQGLEMVLRGEHTSSERIRKLLILLDFYSFWMKSAIRSGKRGVEYQAKGGDADRFLTEVNRYLYDSGFHELYAGNPYDWLFLFLAEMEEPLSVFREFIHNAYLLKEDELISNEETRNHGQTNPTE